MVCDDQLALRLESYSDDSKVWVFQAVRALDSQEINKAERYLSLFADSWVSHGADVSGDGIVWYDRFVIMIADEARSTGVGGCSTDSMMRAVRYLSDDIGVDFFDRQQVCIMVDHQVKDFRLDQLSAAYESGTIQDNTLIFDNMVNTKIKLLLNWLKPLKDSWHFRFVRQKSVR